MAVVVQLNMTTIFRHHGVRLFVANPCNKTTMNGLRKKIIQTSVGGVILIRYYREEKNQYHNKIEIMHRRIQLFVCTALSVKDRWYQRPFPRVVIVRHETLFGFPCRCVVRL